jgi:hypothetical protein
VGYERIEVRTVILGQWKGVVYREEEEMSAACERRQAVLMKMLS